MTPGTSRPAASRALAALFSPWWVAGILLVVYLTTYAALSWTGRYSNPDTSITLVGGGMFIDERTWLINGMWLGTQEPGDPSTDHGYAVDRGLPSRVLGILFLPLIAADRAWIHQTTRHRIHIIQ